MSEVTEGYSKNGASNPSAGGGGGPKFPFRVLSGKIKTAGSSLKSTANTAAAGIANQVKIIEKIRMTASISSKVL